MEAQEITENVRIKQIRMKDYLQSYTWYMNDIPLLLTMQGTSTF